MDMNCAYCAKGELVAKFGYEVCELPASTVYLFKEQSHPGRVIVASKHHVSEMLELSLEDRTAFIEDVVTTANAIHKVFHPDKVNYGMYGDTGHHLCAPGCHHRAQPQHCFFGYLSCCGSAGFHQPHSVSRSGGAGALRSGTSGAGHSAAL